ncbi:MAG: TlpA family protein disulfide reductase [Comamonadaceae bacterium]|nr:MAG: TlpA family protein disulfide reductase [Comamonadaceae bacterium]
MNNSHPDQSRRRWLVGTVAGAATLAGVGLAWQTLEKTPAPQILDSAFWQLKFATPGGTTLSLQSMRGKPLLLNFWATWCPPCIEELPLLSSFYKENSHNGWQVLGLAVDELDPVKRFLAHSPVSFPVALAGFSGLELGKTLGNLIGGLPFTVVIDPGAQIIHRKMGKVTPDELRAWLAPA